MQRRAGARVAVLVVPLAALSVSTAFQGAGPAAAFSRPLTWQQGLGICRARDGDGCFSRLFGSARRGKSSEKSILY